MIAYIDSSALLKRVIAEVESTALITDLAERVANGDALVCSSLGWIEVTRSLRKRFHDRGESWLHDKCDLALSGVLQRPIDGDVVALARRLDGATLRSLDAIHLASALLTDVDVVVAYDLRLLDAVRQHGLVPSSPGM